MCYSRVSTARARLAHLYEHRKTFNKYTIYAHNGGSFDFVLLLDKEHGLLNKENTLWKIDTTKNAPIEQNGRWTTVTLNSVKDEECKSRSFAQTYTQNLLCKGWVLQRCIFAFFTSSISRGADAKHPDDYARD